MTQRWSTAQDHSTPHVQVPCLRCSSPVLRTLALSPVRSRPGQKATMVPHRPGDSSTHGHGQGKTFSEPQADPWHLTPVPLLPSTPVPRCPCSPAPLLPSTPASRHLTLVHRSRCPCPLGLPPSSRTSCQTGLPAWLMPMGTAGCWTGRQGTACPQQSVQGGGGPRTRVEEDSAS